MMMKVKTKLRPTVYLRNFGRTQVNSAFSCYLASATGWTFPKPPAILLRSQALAVISCKFKFIRTFKHQQRADEC